jgi:hypothetical protein
MRQEDIMISGISSSSQAAQAYQTQQQLQSSQTQKNSQNDQQPEDTVVLSKKATEASQSGDTDSGGHSN